MLCNLRRISRRSSYNKYDFVQIRLSSQQSFVKLCFLVHPNSRNYVPTCKKYYKYVFTFCSFSNGARVISFFRRLTTAKRQNLCLFLCIVIRLPSYWLTAENSTLFSFSATSVSLSLATCEYTLNVIFGS